MGKGGAAISDYILHLPEAESVTLSGPTALRLIRCGDGDAALLYIAILKNRGGGDDGKLRAQRARGAQGHLGGDFKGGFARGEGEGYTSINFHAFSHLSNAYEEPEI